jgi:16S rRNA (uracil1498-N3)-methyltransferase
MPVIDQPLLFDDWLVSRERVAQEVLLDPAGESSLMSLRPNPAQITLLIGPEGGLSTPERERAISSGLTPVRLGPRVLRTETAVIAALSAVQTLWGDLGAPADTNP